MICIVIAIVVLLAGCTQMRDFYPDMQVVVIDGSEVAVGPMRGQQDVFHAMPNRPTGDAVLRGDPRVLPANISAIEAVSGCRVDRDSILIRELRTIAAVNCAPHSGM